MKQRFRSLITMLLLLGLLEPTMVATGDGARVMGLNHPLFLDTPPLAGVLHSEALAPHLIGAYHSPHDSEAIVEVQKVTLSRSGLRKRRSEKVDVIFVHMRNIMLRAVPWSKRVTVPFSTDELERFHRGDGLTPLAEFDLTGDDVQSVSHTTYDRQGPVTVRARVQDCLGRVYLLKFLGTDTSALGKLKDLMEPFATLRYLKALLQISAGNQGDLPGNFTIFSQKGKWRYYGGNNDRLFGQRYRGFVQMRNGQRLLGRIQLSGDPATNEVHDITLIPIGSRRPMKLDPSQVDFACVAYALGWGRTPVQILLEQQYIITSDLRHIFRLPYLKERKRNVFYEQLVRDGETLKKAFAHQAIHFHCINDAGESLDRHALTKMLIDHGYSNVDSVNQVIRPGNFFIENNTLHIVLLPAVYPVNCLAISADGEKLVSVNILGVSGQKGANYWTFSRWVRREVKRRYGWTPYAILALDNGMDPQVIQYHGGTAEKLVEGGRGFVNMAFSAVPLPDFQMTLAPGKRWIRGAA